MTELQELLSRERSNNASLEGERKVVTVMSQTFMTFQGTLEKIGQLKREMSRLESERMVVEKKVKDLQAKLEEQGQSFQAQVAKRNKREITFSSDGLKGWGNKASTQGEKRGWVLLFIDDNQASFRQGNVREAGERAGPAGHGDQDLPEDPGGRGEEGAGEHQAEQGQRREGRREQQQLRERE